MRTIAFAVRSLTLSRTRSIREAIEDAAQRDEAPLSDEEDSMEL